MILIGKYIEHNGENKRTYGIDIKKRKRNYYDYFYL